MTDFYQDPPRLGDPWRDDPLLRGGLARLLPADVCAAVVPGLARLGARAGGELMALARAAESQPPRHVPYDAWGRRVDDIEVSSAWRAFDAIAAEEGIVASAYERAHGEHSRVEQMARLYLYHPSSAIHSCPLAMTDGAARCLELHGGDDPAFHEEYARLTTRDPARFWTSGQWMTERSGGSDVSGTSTVARPGPGGEWRLHGVKWFTSATTSQMALTLARIDGAEGLSLFRVRLRDADGRLQGIRVHRLKDKLGTRALPTAELTLDDAPARLVGGAGDGVRRIASVLNVTRYYNAVCAAAGMRRAVMLARDYATRRVAFGRPIARQPLHVETLAAMEVETAGAFQLVLHLAALLGRLECGTASPSDELCARILTPVAKLFTARQAVALASEALEAFGGAGYVEDTGLPVLLRDAQVLAIWEGTTNVLALDVLRAAARGDALGALRADLARRVAGITDPAVADAAARVDMAIAQLPALAGAASGDEARAQAEARDVAFGIARVTTGALLLEHAQWAGRRGDPRPAIVARRWCARELVAVPRRDRAWRDESAALLHAGDATPVLPAVPHGHAVPA